jgi:superfamily II DNA or RNA helicase
LYVEQVVCSKLDNVYMRLDCEPSTLTLLKEYFTFEVPNAKFMRGKNSRYKNWDGKISLLDMRSRKMYIGLFDDVKKFCEFNDIEVIDDGCTYYEDNLDPHKLKEFVDSLDLEYPVREYQLEYFIGCLRNKRKTILSPTGSGKSLIIYMISEWYRRQGKKILIIVPTIHLVKQMAGDFIDYVPSSEKHIHVIHQGQEKETDSPFVISTWQSIYDLPEEFFEDVDVVFGDECHMYQAAALQKLMQKTSHIEYKFGTTGTLDGVECNRLILTGVFGEVEKLVSTSQLIDEGILAKLSIKCLVLNYNKIDIKKYKKEVGKGDYHGEMGFIVQHDKRNKFLSRLVNSLEGNTLLLFQYVDKHGIPLEKIVKEDSTKKDIHLIHGGISGDERERIRNLVDKSTNNVIIASYGTFSTGANIKNINNVIFASPSKSRVRVLQSIGRGLRISDIKDSCTLFDIVDNLKDNFALKHFEKRVELYAEEGFPYKIIEMDI